MSVWRTHGHSTNEEKDGKNMRLRIMEWFWRISRWFANRTFAKKLRKTPEKVLTLLQLCEKVGIPTDALAEDVQRRLDEPVSQIARFGGYLVRNAICLQLYGDEDFRMRKAMQAGALVCMSDHDIENVPCLVVKDVPATYAAMCAVYRDMAPARGTAVTGSIGKTTVKRMIDSVYAQDFTTFCDPENDNLLNSIGSVCQRIPDTVQQYIAELSEDTPGLLALMTEIVRPDILVYTAIDKSHIEAFGTQERIIEEFATAARYLRKGGVCIMSRDELNPAHLLPDVRMQFVSQKDRDADYFANDVRVDPQGLTFTVHVRATGKAYPVRLHNIFAVHNVTSALLAFAAGVASGMEPEQIVCGLNAFRTSGIRQNIYKSGATTVYADCFNAVAKSVRAAVETASKIPVRSGCKRIAVLGDIAETGEYTQEVHRELVEIVDNSDFAALLTCGENLRRALEQNAVRDDLQVYTFENQKAMNRQLKKLVRNGDLVLFKASHSGRLKTSIRAVFPLAYLRESIKYYTPRIKWYFRVILN